jgi:hypothetical protein
MAAGELMLTDPIEGSSYDILMASLREQIPPETIAALEEEGARLDLDRSLDEAFELCVQLCRSSVERG